VKIAVIAMVKHVCIVYEAGNFALSVTNCTICSVGSQIIGVL
jgi:hypothetical protein